MMRGAISRVISVAVGALLVFLGVGATQGAAPRGSLDDTEGTRPPVLVRVVACWPALPLARPLVSAYGRGSAHVVPLLAPMSSEEALGRLSSAEADVAIVSRPWDAASGRVVLDSGDAVYAPRVVALDALVVAVSDANPVRELDGEEVARLFQGQVLDWSEVGEHSGLPQPVAMRPDTVSGALFQESMIGSGVLGTNARVVPHVRAMLSSLRDDPAAVGYVSRAWLRGREGNGVHAVAVDAVRPGTYPVSSALVILTRPGASREATALADHILGPLADPLVRSRYVAPPE